MMNGVEVRAAFSGDVDLALPLVADELAKLGYENDELEARALKMRFKGKWVTTDPGKMRHFVAVKPDAACLVFAFGTGIVASYWSDSDRAWAQQRADAIVAAVQAQFA